MGPLNSKDGGNILFAVRCNNMFASELITRSNDDGGDLMLLDGCCCNLLSLDDDDGGGDLNIVDNKVVS